MWKSRNEEILYEAKVMVNWELLRQSVTGKMNQSANVLGGFVFEPNDSV